MKSIFFAALLLFSVAGHANYQQIQMENQRELIIEVSETELKGQEELCIHFVNQFNTLLENNKLVAALTGQNPAEVDELDVTAVCY